MSQRPMKRASTIAKWKQVLGFDDGGGLTVGVARGPTPIATGTADLGGGGDKHIRVRETERERERQRVKDTDTDTVKDKDKDKDKDKQKDKQKEKEKEKEKAKETARGQPRRGHRHALSHSEIDSASISSTRHSVSSSEPQARQQRQQAASTDMVDDLETAYDDSPEVVQSSFPEAEHRKPAGQRTSFSDAPELVPTSPVESEVPLVAEAPIVYDDGPMLVDFLDQLPPLHRFPRDITFTKSGLDFLMCPAPPAPSLKEPKPLPHLPPLFYVSIHEQPPGAQNSAAYTSSIPDIAIHSANEPSSALLAFANFHSVTLQTAITLLPPPPSPSVPQDATQPTYVPVHLSSVSAFGNRAQGHRTIKLSSTGGIFSAEKYQFSHTLPRTSVLETFEWRHSSSSMIRSLSQSCTTFDIIHDVATPDSSSETPPAKVKKSRSMISSRSNSTKPNLAFSGGLKLVRSTTSKTIAIFAGDREGRREGNPRKAVGMLRFLAGDDGLGEEFELLVVASILAIMERGKRVMDVHRQTLGDGLV